jgi:hypothetical protein
MRKWPINKLPTIPILDGTSDYIHMNMDAEKRLSTFHHLVALDLIVRYGLVNLYNYYS